MADEWRKATDEEILEFARRKYEPFITSSDVSDEFDMVQQSAYDRLTDLHKEGYLETRKVGAKSRVYWLTDEGRRLISS